MMKDESVLLAGSYEGDGTREVKAKHADEWVTWMFDLGSLWQESLITFQL